MTAKQGTVPSVRGAARTLPGLLWAYGRHELLYLCWALMEVALLAPVALAALEWARYWPPPAFALWLLLLMLLPFNLNRVLTLAKVPLRRQRQVILLAFLLTLLVSLRTLLYEPTSLWDLSWLRALATHFIEEDNPLWGRDFAIFFLVGLLWWRGISFTGRRVDIDDIGLRLRVGVLLAPLVAGTGMLYRTPVTPFILLFFLAALLAISLTRAEQVAQEQNRQSYPIQPCWLAFIVGTILLILLAATLLALAVSGGEFSTWLAPLGQAIRLTITVTVAIFSYLIFLLLTPLGWLLRPLAPGLALPELSEGQNPLFEVTEEVLQPLQVGQQPTWIGLLLFWLERFFILLVIAGILLVLYMALSRFLSERRLAPASEESAGGRGSRQREGAGWGSRLLRQFNFWQQRRASASVRRIYRQMARAAGDYGFPRGSAQTPYEHLASLAELWPEGVAEAELITGAYVRVRYGEAPETQAEIDELLAAWRHLQTLVPPE